MKSKRKWSDESKAKLRATLAAKKATASVVPLDTLPVEVKRGRPLGSTKSRYAATGQPPIIVQFGKIKISIEVNG